MKIKRLRIMKEIIRSTYLEQVLFGMILLIVVVSLVLVSVEPGVEHFGDGLWYSFAVVTTIGFGDVIVVTLIGRMLSVVLGIYAIAVVSIFTSAVITYYGDCKKILVENSIDNLLYQLENLDTLSKEELKALSSVIQKRA